MTSNQLAYQSNVIADKRVEYENQVNVRKNELTEAANSEIQRHNMAMEDIQNRANLISQQVANQDGDYKRTMAALEREYKQATVALQSTLGVRRLEIEERLANIQEQKNHITEEYNAVMAGIERDRVNISQQAQVEVERHNISVENIQRDMNKLQGERNDLVILEQDIKTKQLEFERTQWRETYGLKKDDLYLRQQLALVEAQRLMLGVNQLQLELDRYQNVELPESKSRIYSNVIKSTVGALREGAQALTGTLGAMK